MLRIVEFDKMNWEEALDLTVTKEQQAFMPSVAEALAFAYIKPWDEALDPYLIYDGDVMIGTFYISYTPDSKDNYWLGGFFIDTKYQRKGYGKKSLTQIIEFVKTKHQKSEQLYLTIVHSNHIARKLYESFGFKTDGKVNKYDEVIYCLKW